MGMAGRGQRQAAGAAAELHGAVRAAGQALRAPGAREQEESSRTRKQEDTKAGRHESSRTRLEQDMNGCGRGEQQVRLRRVSGAEEESIRCGGGEHPMRQR